MKIKTFLISTLMVLTMTVMAWAEAPDRTQPPLVGKPASVVIPAMEKRVLSNGIPVWFSLRDKVPLANVFVLVDAGAKKDPRGLYGLSARVAEAVDQGCGDYSALEFCEAVQLLGGTLGVDNGYDAIEGVVTVPSARLDKAIPLLAACIINPRFEQADCDRLRHEGLTSFVQMRDDPASIAGASFLQHIFGADSRFSVGVSGNAEDYARITREDMQRFHAAYFTPQNTSLIVAGDVDIPATMDMLEDAFGQWKADPGAVAEYQKSVEAASQVPQREAKAVPASRDQIVYVVDRPGSPQTVIKVGCQGVTRSTPYYFHYQLLNTIFGGSFGSRLNQNLRERNKYTYGAHSRFNMGQTVGRFTVDTSVQTDVTAKAVKEILIELDRMQQPVTADELARAQACLGYGFPANFETSGQLVSMLALLKLYDLPDNFYNDYVGTVMGMTIEDLVKPASLFFSNKMAVTMVGDAKVVKPALEENGWNVVVLSVDDVMGPNIAPIK